MKKIKSAIASVCAAIFLTGCVDDTIYDTPHPSQGRITFSIDWSGRTDGIAIPPTLTARAAGHTAQIPGQAGGEFPNLIEPGDYRLGLNNTAGGIAISGTAATVATVATPPGATGTFVDPQPGWLFTWAADQRIDRDRDYNITAVMRQQVRELTLAIEPTGGTADMIASVAATLTGVASQLDIDNGTHSAPASVAMAFTENASDGKYYATVRLLGVTGTQQMLSVTITFTGGNPAPVTEEHDLTTLLSAFNADKKTPLALGAQVVETSTGAGFTATITNWNKTSGSVEVK